MIWNNEIYHRLTTTPATTCRGGIHRRRRRPWETNSSTTTTATLFHLILLVRVLLSFYGILGIMQQYKDADDNDNNYKATATRTIHDLEQLMDMPDHHHHHHHHQLLLIKQQHKQQQRAAKNNHDDDDDALSAGATAENNDNSQEQEIDIVFPFAAVVAPEDEKRPPPASSESVHKAALLVRRRRPRRQVSCGAHFASSCSECPQGNGEVWCNGQCVWNKTENECVEKPSFVHPDYHLLLEEYPFQPVANENGTFVNVMLVRAPFQNARQKDLFLKYKDNDILFLGISSYETFPLSSPNPYSTNVSHHHDDEYQSLFPGFLTLMRHPEEYFAPSSVKTILLSQSDFNLDSALEYHEHHHVSSSSSQKGHEEKKYDFVYSGTDQDVDNNCVGWSSFAKNWTFVVQALEVMCNDDDDDEFNLTGVLVATQNKAGTKACDIPNACAGKIVQTSFLSQDDFFHYLSQSKFAFIPQVYDASPRVITQAMAMNVPVLMNDNIVGGWKYLNNETGEFFHDLSNFRPALQKLLDGIETGNHYEPRKFVTEHYGNEHSGVKLKDFVMSNWGDRVVLPEGTRWLIPSGA